MDKETVNSLVSEAQHIAENAGNLIMTFFDELAEEEVEYKAEQSPVTLADKAANKQIVDELINSSTICLLAALSASVTGD